MFTQDAFEQHARSMPTKTVQVCDGVRHGSAAINASALIAPAAALTPEILDQFAAALVMAHCGARLEKLMFPHQPKFRIALPQAAVGKNFRRELN